MPHMLEACWCQLFLLVCLVGLEHYKKVRGMIVTNGYCNLAGCCGTTWTIPGAAGADVADIYGAMADNAVLRVTAC